MESSNDLKTSPTSNFGIFMARLIALWLFCIFVVLWIIKGLPFQLTNLVKEGSHHVPVAFWLVSVATSSLVLVFFIIPMRVIASILALLMYTFVQTYVPFELSLLNPALLMVIIPFVFPNSWFPKSLLILKWGLLLSLALHSWLLPLSWKAIPGYTLYLIPFIDWERLFVRFNERFEPR